MDVHILFRAEQRGVEVDRERCGRCRPLVHTRVLPGGAERDEDGALIEWNGCQLFGISVAFAWPKVATESDAWAGRVVQSPLRRY